MLHRNCNHRYEFLKMLQNWVSEASYSNILVLTPLNAFDVDTVLNHLPQRGHFPQSLDLFYRPVSSVHHLILSCKTANSKSEMDFCCKRNFLKCSTTKGLVLLLYSTNVKVQSAQNYSQKNSHKISYAQQITKPI